MNFHDIFKTVPAFTGATYPIGPVDTNGNGPWTLPAFLLGAILIVSMTWRIHAKFAGGAMITNPRKRTP